MWIQFSTVQSLSSVQLIMTPWIAAHQASLSITNSWSSLKLMSIKSVMPSCHLILCCPFLLLPPIPPSIRVHSKGDWSWVFFGSTDAEAETAILWPPHAKSWLIGKDSDAGRDWGQEEKGMTEDEMAGWHHRLDGCEFGWTPGVGDGQGGLSWCSPWGRKELDMTEWLNWTELIPMFLIFVFPYHLCHHRALSRATCAIK